MKRFVALLLMTMLFFTSCQSSVNSQSSSTEAYTLTEFSEKTKTQVVEYGKSYTFETSTTGADGDRNQFAGVSFIQCGRSTTLDVGSEVLENVIYFEVIADETQMKDFLSNKCYLITYDKYGNSNSLYSSGTYSPGENLYLVFYGTEPITSAKFFELGGLSREKNGFSSILFEFIHPDEIKS